MPLPIVRKIADLHERIVLGGGGQPTNKDWSNQIAAGSDIKNLFDGDNTTVCEIKNGFGGSCQGCNRRYITFDFGKPRIIDRIVFTQPAGNASYNFDFNFSYWIPGADIFTSPTFHEYHGAFNHNNEGENIIHTTKNSIDVDNSVNQGYLGTPTSNHEIRYLRIEIADNNYGSGWTMNYSQNWKFTGLDIYEQFDTRDFSVEFNDSVLDTQGWTGPRYSGCKTIGKEINEYTPTSSIWQGDTTYGLNPNLENKTTAIYYSTTVQGGREDNQFADIAHHSYINIEKIIIVNQDDDSVRVLERETEPFDAFHRFITTDFPTGGKFSMRILDEGTPNNLKDSYYVKMNKGWLLKSFSYSAGKGPLPGVDENGNNLETAIGHLQGVRNSVANPLSLYDAISGSIQRAEHGYPGGMEGIPGITTVQGPVVSSTAHTFSSGWLSSLGAGTLATYQYGAQVFEDDANGDFYLINNLTGSANLLDPVFDSFSFEKYGMSVSPFTSSYEPTSIGELRFRYGVIQTIDDVSGAGGEEAKIFQPLYCGDNTEILDNKFTRQFVDPTNNQQTDTRFFKLDTIEDVEDRKTDLGQVATKDFKYWVKDKNWNPSITASVFIGNCVQHLNENATETELHLTLFEGTKDFSGKNDELSISTFEIDKNISPSYLNFESNIGPLTKTIGPRARYLKLKNQPQFKPIIATASFSTTAPNGDVTVHETGRDRHVFDIVETDKFRLEIEERQNSFVFGPGTTNQNLDSDCGIVTGQNYVTDYDNSPDNSSNFSGSFKYEISFLDKDHTLIADVDKPAELFDGYGGNGVVLIPEYTNACVKLNVDYYLDKAGISNLGLSKIPCSND